MITGYSHTTVWVLDQDSAKAFYTEKLGLVVGTDFDMGGGVRWLTVSHPEQTDIQLVLLPPTQPMLDEESAAMVRSLVAKGAFGAGVFRTDDCRKTYEELSGKGVTFQQEPSERPYGIEAVFRDDSGNWFSLTQPHSGG
jgi:catechol 2,3-dioxygenase-like lactoylglutathione lyase family enzyme